MRNWFDYILFHLRTRPEQPAIVMEDRVVTYAMLRGAVDRCARRVADLNLADGEPVAVMMANPIRHVTLLLALHRMSVPSVSLEHGPAGVSDLTFPVVLGDEAAKVRVNPRNRFVAVGDDWFGADAGGEALPGGILAGGHVCHLAPTSGTTGQSKMIALTVDEVGRRLVGFNGFNWTRILCLPGLSSIWSYISVLATLATGRTVCFSGSPFQSVRMIELFAIDYVAAATEQLLALTRVVRKTGAHLPSLRLIETSGSVPTASLLDAAMSHLCKDIYCRYGTSELGQMARVFAREVVSRPGLVGHIMPGIEVAIVGADGKACAPGETGLIRSRLNPVWFEDSKASAWIDLGDVGHMTEQGELFVLGRQTDTESVAQDSADGRRISPIHEVEHLLRLEWDAADAAAVLVGDEFGQVAPELWIGIVDCKDASVARLGDILRNKGIDIPLRLFPMSSIPRGLNGKVQRAQLKEAMLAAKKAT